MACKTPSQEAPIRRGYDDYGCLSLQSVLDTFNAAINKEQAWAVCFQFLKTAKTCLDENRSGCFYATTLEHVKLHKDGSVHRTTFYGNSAEPDYAWREPVTSDSKLVADLGLIMYKAVDYGLGYDVERKLDPALGNLICRMVPSAAKARMNPSANDSREDDEGIEQDAGETDDGDRQGILDDILQECINNLISADEEKADMHYKQVCRAWIAECMDLGAFLDKVGRGRRELKTVVLEDDPNFNINDLHSTDWERLWVQVIQQLRDGVKLKKSDAEVEKKAVEYELTPYEMLMNDIRSKKYKLNKVPLEGGLPPRVKEDAHTLILDFIRSRPPLKKANDRQLVPPKVELTLHDQLMEAIRNTKPTALKPTRHSMSHLKPTGASADQPDGVNADGTVRRRITVDHCFTTFDDSSDDDSDTDAQEPPPPPQPVASPRRRLQVDEKTREVIKSTKSKRPTKLYDGAKKDEKAMKEFDQERRHSVNSPNSSRSMTSPEPPPFDLATPSSKSVFQEALMQSNMWRQQIDCLSLTLEEVVHIRSVLTRAELETLLFDMKLYKDVAKGKVCFSCRKTRFGLFGSKDYTCKLCEQVVCRKCCSTMEIPMDHLQTVPVFFLSPPQSNDPSPSEGEPTTGPKSLFTKLEGLYKEKTALLNRNSVGSAPNSPQFSRSKSLVIHDDPNSRSKSPQVLKDGEKGSSLLRRESMTVCTDCQVMVKQIILSSHQTLRARNRRTSKEFRAAGSPSSPEHRSITPT